MSEEALSTLSPAAEEDLLTYQEREVFESILYAYLGTAVCLLGITANVINIIVFLKQGFSYTVNISLCGLALSDLGCLITQTGLGAGSNPLMKAADLSLVISEVEYLTCGLPSVCFSRITAWITVYVTAERCVGVAVPLKVKTILTSSRAVAAVVIIYLFNFLAFSPDYLNLYLDWKFDSIKNRTVFGMVIRNSDPTKTSIIFISATTAGLLSFLSVVIFTTILVWHLAQKSAWRKQVTSANRKSESVSNRDKKTMKMIILIASVMIVCYTPGTILTIASILRPEFGVFGRFSNTFFALWPFAFLSQNVNSSVNILLYYNMSTKYRQTFQTIFKSCTKTTVKSET